MSRAETLFLAAALAILGAVLGASVERLTHPAPHVQAVHPSRDSIVAATALSRAALAEYASQVAQARGDSLAALLAARARASRVRWLPGRVDTVELVDSILVPAEDVRAVIVSDSACRVEADSLRGELVQARYDAETCADALQERPESCGTWTAFGLGFGLGATAAAGACVLVR